MRLVNTSTVELTEFFGTHIPRYGILSHCWGEQEVSLKDFTKDRNRQAAGYKKIADCCAFALNRKIEWIWVDTCCIDKKSSAELSEAINSMFKWYEAAVECYAHLADVPFLEDRGDLMENFECSKWFTRGWTLQELIAPSQVIFVSSDWKVLGCKLDGNIKTDGCSGLPQHRPVLSARVPGDNGPDLIEELSAKTFIPKWVLQERGSFADCSIATRMSWVACRETTREEDMAYCLLGLFDINMPPLYGEGLAKAFSRLQREILALSDDESIFAWKCWPDTLEDHGAKRTWPILADTPRFFSRCWGVSALREAKRKYKRPPYMLTNQGLELRLCSGSVSGAFNRKNSTRRMLLFLNCERKVKFEGGRRDVPCFVELSELACGHYARKIEKTQDFEDVLARLAANDWMPLEEDRTCYLHVSSTKISCSKGA